MKGRSDPRSSRYGQHLSVEEVHDLFAPSQETVDNVRAWLESEGISASRISQSSNKQFLQFDASAAEVERLLNTEYYLYQHAGTGRSHIACREYVLAFSPSDKHANHAGTMCPSQCKGISTTSPLASSY
jgi:subtilase family serine protease